MSEDDDLRRLFQTEKPIEPGAGLRRAAIEAAMARFEDEARASSQGFGVLNRLRNRMAISPRRLRSMTSLRSNYALWGATSVAVLALLIVGNNTVRVQLQPPAEERKEADSLQPVTPLQSADSPTEIADAPGDASLPYTPPAANAQIGPIYDRVVGEIAASPKAQSMAPRSRLAKKDHSNFLGVGTDDVSAGYFVDQGRDRFTDIQSNPVKVTREDPVSTFSIDVDTSSYSFVRAALNQNVLPQKDAVRVEELINYFPYDYPGPADKSVPFKATATIFQTPWNSSTKLLHIGIKGFSLNGQEKPRSNLVFLVDTSGSMDEPNKLPLLVNSLKLLLDSLGPEDTVSIVAYAGSAGTVLEPTKVGQKARIIASLDRLSSGGSTAGAEGIRQAYQLAEASFDRTGINRVILATDGDFNVGIADPEELKSFVERKRATGIYLSVLGFGRGNYNDELMQTLAQNGNGNAAYIDTLNEARKVLVDEASATLFPIAKDVKIQIEFNPQMVSEYRLVGYETRLLNREDFNNDKVDAGDIGSGHTVTAIYEITPRASSGKLVDDLRYGKAQQEDGRGDEYAFLKLRYKLPDSDKSTLVSTPVTKANEVRDVEAAPADVGFATSVAAFGQILRGGQYTGTYTLDDVAALARRTKGDDPFGYRSEFVNLVRIARTAQTLEPQTGGGPLPLPQSP